MGRGSELWDRFETAFATADWNALISLFAPDGVYVEPAGRHEGLDAIRAWIEQWAPAVSDLRFDTELVVADGDVIIAEYVGYSTHTGPITMPDGSVIPPSGKTLVQPAVTILRVREGQIVEARDYFDQVPGLVHLGLMPTG